MSINHRHELVGQAALCDLGHAGFLVWVEDKPYLTSDGLICRNIYELTLLGLGILLRDLKAAQHSKDLPGLPDYMVNLHGQRMMRNVLAGVCDRVCFDIEKAIEQPTKLLTEMAKAKVKEQDEPKKASGSG